MKTLFAVMIVAAGLFGGPPAKSQPVRPVVVLVHGAFADASSWNAVIRILESDGYHVLAIANPLRSVSGDAQYLTNILKAIGSPVVLVGHSYGGSVISAAAFSSANVK